VHQEQRGNGGKHQKKKKWCGGPFKLLRRTSAISKIRLGKEDLIKEVRTPKGSGKKPAQHRERTRSMVMRQEHFVLWKEP